MIGKIKTSFACMVLVLTSQIHAQQYEPEKLPVKVVVVTAFEIGDDAGDTPGEFQNWVENLPLSEIYRFRRVIINSATIRRKKYWELFLAKGHPVWLPLLQL